MFFQKSNLFLAVLMFFQEPSGQIFGSKIPFWTHFWIHSGASCRLLLAFRRLLCLIPALRLPRVSRFAKGFQAEGRDRSAPSSNRPVSPRSGRARAEAIYTIIHACCVDALVALALLLLVALAPQAIMYACCVPARSALAVPALLLLVVLALLLSSLLLLSLLLRRLQCLSLYRLSRFPFHDSQVYFR